jgi:prepilin peptidase CpaA
MYIKLIEIVALLLLSLISDIKTYRIKNSITFPFVALGLITNFLSGGLQGLGDSLAAFILPPTLLIILYMARMLGAGDIKLFRAIGSIMGTHFVFHATICSFLCGGIIALAVIIIRKNGRQRMQHLIKYIKTCIATLSLHPYTTFEDKRDGAKFRFSYAIFSGTMISLLVLQGI